MLRIDIIAGKPPGTEAQRGEATRLVDAMIAKVEGAQGHPAQEIARHLGQLFHAAAELVAASSDGHIDMSGWAGHLHHICDTHTYAALYLMACMTDLGPEGAITLLREGDDIITDLLGAG